MLSFWSQQETQTDLAAVFLVKLDGVLRNIAESLERGAGLLDVDAHFVQGFAHGVDDAVPGGLGAAQRTAHAHRLAGDEAGVLGAGEFFIFVHHPDHVLGVGHDIGGRNVLQRADVADDLPTQPRQICFLLAHGEIVRIADDPALAAAEGNVDHGAFPGHPGGQGLDRVDGFLGVEADAALAGTAGIVVLHAETLEDLDRPVVHPDRDRKVIFSQRVSQQVSGCLIQVQFLGNIIELLLCHFESVE